MSYVLHRITLENSRGAWMVDGPGSDIIDRPGHQLMMRPSHRFCLMRFENHWYVTENAGGIIHRRNTTWLGHHGLADVGFATRREALARLADALEREPS